MKNQSIVSGLAIVTLLSAAAIHVLAEPKEVTLEGEIIDLHCYMINENKGPGHKTCAIQCAKAGNPIGLLTADGEIYLLMGAKKHTTSNDILIEKMASIVSLTGAVSKKKGVQALYVASVK